MTGEGRRPPPEVRRARAAGVALGIVGLDHVIHDRVGRVTPREGINMKTQMLNGRVAGEQTARVRFIGPNLGIALKETPLQEIEETLISDPRGNLRPSEIVEQRLTSLLLLGRVVSQLGAAGRLHHLHRARHGGGALAPGGAARARIQSAN